MKYFYLIAVSAWICLLAQSVSAGSAVLRIYGPGGPYRVMQECAELFSRRSSIEVVVTKGVPESWIKDARVNADLIYGGAEYMLVECDKKYPGLIDMATIRKLYPRQIGIIVRRGNPKKILTLSDLGREGIKILDVQLEEMEIFQERALHGRGNIARSVVTGEDGRAAWLAAPELDAWITYRSWHRTMPSESEFIPITGTAEASRFTPVALAIRSTQRKTAEAFIRFLETDEAHKVFMKHGWE
jgi:accessory colonization factor AcfC